VTTGLEATSAPPLECPRALNGERDPGELPTHEVTDRAHAGVSQFEAASYRALLRVPGCTLLYGRGAFARLPVAMLRLALVLVVRDADGSYAEAAAVVAAHTTAVPLTQPLVSRPVDCTGQRRVLLPWAFGFPVLLLLVVWLIHSQAPLAITLVGAAAIGALLPRSRPRYYRALSLDAMSPPSGQPLMASGCTG
jgi:hypothetical protein